MRKRDRLYGHHESGSFWEEHCDKCCKEAGFVPLGIEWPSTYHHPALGLFLVVYVDDFKLSGPAENLAKGWALLRKDLHIDKETGHGQYLGCGHESGTFSMPAGSKATSVSYNMESFWDSCVQRYVELAGPDVRIKKVPTPFLAENSEKGPSGAPCAKGPITECTWCAHTFSPTTYKDLDDLNKKTKKGLPTGNNPSSEDSPSGGNLADKNDSKIKGRLAEHAACILMKCLYSARMARFDLLRAITSLACQLTRWTPECDRKLHRLMCYIHSSKHLRMFGYVGNSLTEVQPHLFADADFAGCAITQRSTSGLHLCIRGTRTCFPIAGQSKRQGCVSHSTPEAEIVAADFGLRLAGLPALDLWHELLPRKPPLFLHEDNQAMIRVCKTGRNPTMRHIGRTHRVSVAFTHERFTLPGIDLVYEMTHTQRPSRNQLNGTPCASWST